MPEVLALFAEQDVLAELGVVLHEFEPLTGVRLVFHGPVLKTSTTGRTHLYEGTLIASH